MNETQRYELEMAREIDSEDQTPEQRAAIKREDAGGMLDAERQVAMNDRRAQGIDDRLIRGYQLYEGLRDSTGRETWDTGTTAPTTGSRAYTNITRQVTNDGAAQIGDLLFPNDDRNYGLKALMPSKPALAIEAEPAVNSKGKPITDAEGNQLTNMQAHMRRAAGVKKKTARMFSKIDTSLIKSRYPTKAREVIRDGAVYGAGVLKGPIPTKDSKGRWARKGGEYKLNRGVDMHPDVRVVNPMDFFPDSTATCIEDARYTWERQALTPYDLEMNATSHGYDKAAVKYVLNMGVTTNAHTTDSDAVDEAKAPVTVEGRMTGRFTAWERHGVLDRDTLEALGVTVKGDKEWHNAIVTMCNAVVLKAVIVEYEAAESLYSVYCWDEDPLSIFGYGIPWLMQDQQASYVAAWRMALDNGGLSAAPQILIDRTQVTPVDGKWQMHGGKEWYIKENTYEVGAMNAPFQVVQVTQNIKEIFTMMDRSIADSYEITGVTRVNDSQPSQDNAPVTLGATQILQNNSSVSRRAQARRWDDKVTLGIITRFYDYFMQFDKDEDIKANMEVEPRGATVLLAKELTATNTMQMYQMTQMGTSPGAKGIEILRGIEATMQIPAGSYVESVQEQEAREQQEQEAAEAGNVPDPMFELESRKVEVLEAEVELRMNRDALAELKQQHTLELESARFQLEDAIASANVDDNTQARLDGYHTKMAELEAKRSSEMERLMITNQTSRDQTAATLKAGEVERRREVDIKEREIAQKERELSYKATTGNDGI